MPAATAPPVAPLAPRRIAVLRALMLGDLLCGVPALRSLRAAFPEAEIVLVGLGWARELVPRFRHVVDDFLELPGFPGLQEAEPRVRELPAFLEQAHRLDLDLAVQLHGSGRLTNPLAFLLGARRTAGFYPLGEPCPDPELFVPYPERGHEIHRLLRLPEHLGLPVAGDRLEFPLGAEDEAEVAAVAPGLARGTYACIHPGGRSAAPWEAEGFAHVADVIAAHGLDVVLTGTAGERATARTVVRASRTHALDLAGRTSLGGLAALLAGARLLVSNDTGVSHLAAALAVPSVVVVTTSDPDRWAPLDRELHRVVVRPSTPGPVVAAAESLLAARVAA
ncbi:MAG: LPS biosynthesis glycosyltransferase [Actinomycetota bacterium]|nr:LPS biosynthesis glycosyltransferase [Actinomycetota bacterium]